MKRKNLIIAACVLAAAAAVLFIARNYFLFEENTATAALKAYQLYTAGEKEKEISLYFGSQDTDGFKAVKSRIYDTPRQVNQVKQALLLLLAGPGEAALRVIPEGTMLRDVYIDANDIVYADFSQEIGLNSPGGTTAEYLAVYSILKTIFNNFSWARGARILVDGKETETLTGHISLEGIFRPDDAAGRE
jgi:spore germination protein GerM